MIFKTIEKFFRYVSGFIRSPLFKKSKRGAIELEEQQFKSAEQQQVQAASHRQKIPGERQHARLQERDEAQSAEPRHGQEQQGHQVNALETERLQSRADQSKIVEDMQSQSEDDRQLKSAVESLLFVAGIPLTLDRLQSIFEDVNQAQIEKQLDMLQQEYKVRGSGIMLVEVAGGYQLVTRPENAAWIRTLKSVKAASRLSRPALETLAIMAYKQPITRAEVEALRGVNIGGIVRNLMERRLVKIIGKKDVPGKPMLYGTTQEFLQYFGLKDLSSLPTLKEFQELETGEEIVEAVSVEHETVLLPNKSASEESAESEAVATTQENGTG